MRRIVAGARFVALLDAIVLLPISSALAQSFTWGGSGSTTTTTDYNLGTNWSNPPTSAPPVTAGQAAIFDTTGNSAVSVTAGAIAPNSWTFNPNAQSYTISGGAVNFSQAGSAGGLLDNANSNQTISISNNIGESVTGVQVQLLGQSTLVLAGTNTYSGGTTASNFGTLQVTNNNAVGTGTVSLSIGAFQASGSSNLSFGNNFNLNDTAFGNLMDANGVRLTISGNITGSGALTIQDSTFSGGTVVFTGANTYTGGTTTCLCGTLQLGTLAATGSIVGAVTNDGFINIVNANTTGISSILNEFGGTTRFLNTSSASSINITNASTGGTTLFFDHSTAGNATITNRFELQFNDFSNAGSANITNRFGGEIDFNDHSNAGSATIVNRFAALLNFNDNSSAMNANITNRFGAEIDFNDHSSAGSAVITTLNGAATFFNDNSTGGNAQFITNGTGVVDFSQSAGANGDGVITAGSIAGSGSYIIGAGNTLVVGSNNLSTVVSGVIADSCGCGPGSGSLEKIGSGTLTLSDTNTYTGTTTVNGGFLDVEGSIASSSLTTVNAGGALTGAGIVGTTTIANGGILLPGNGTPGSAMTIAGNLAFQSGALYLVTLNSTTSTFAHVTGTAALAGTVGAAFVPGSTVVKQYKILMADGGVGGGFNGVAIAGGPGGLVASFSNDGTNVFLNFTVDFNATPGLNTNQHNVGNALANFFNANGGIPVVFGLLTPAGLTQASGETATGSQQATFSAMNLFLGLLTDPFIDGRGGSNPSSVGAQPYAEEGEGSLAYAAKKRNAARAAFAKIPTKAEAARNDVLDPRWSVWGAAYGGGANIDGNAAQGSNSTDVRAFGFAAGADYRISPSTLAGFALGGGATSFSVNGFGTGRSDLFQAGAFVRHNFGAAYVTGALAYGGQQVTTDRTVTVAGFDKLHAQFNANAVSGRVEGGIRFATPWMGVTPYAAGQFTTFLLPAYGEQALVGSNAFALNYAAKDVTAVRSELGVRTDRSFALESAILTLRGRFAWAHDFNTDRNVTAVFQALPGASFVVGGAAQARESALTTVSAEMKWLNGWSTAATFEGEFSDISRSYAGKGVVRYTW